MNYPKPYSIYLRGTIAEASGVSQLQVNKQGERRGISRKQSDHLHCRLRKHSAARIFDSLF